MNTQSKAQQLIAAIREAKENVDAIQQLWEATIGKPLEPRQASIWLQIYGFDWVVDGIKATAIWQNKHQQAIQEAVNAVDIDEKQFDAVLKEHRKEHLDFVKFASGCMKNARLRAQDKADKANGR
jgi:hypothetical protein